MNPIENMSTRKCCSTCRYLTYAPASWRCQAFGWDISLSTPPPCDHGPFGPLDLRDGIIRKLELPHGGRKLPLHDGLITQELVDTSSTPETDAINDALYVDIHSKMEAMRKTARKLERERDDCQRRYAARELIVQAWVDESKAKSVAELELEHPNLAEYLERVEKQAMKCEAEVKRLRAEKKIFRCETCQSEATVHIAAIGCHFCAACLQKIDARIAEMNWK